MDKQEIVRLFLSRGFQLSSNAIKTVEQDPEKFLCGVEKLNPRPFIITEEHLKKVLDIEKTKKKQEVNILFKITQPKDILKPEDFIKCYSKIYEKASKILSNDKRLERLITINKITDKTRKFSVIGMVREKEKNNLLVEDNTGELFLFNDGASIDDVEIDDVLGFICENGDRFYLKDVVYPEIPLSKEVGKSEFDIKLFYFYKPSLIDEELFSKIVEKIRRVKKRLIFSYGDWRDREIFRGLGDVVLISEEDKVKFLEIGGIKILTVSFDSNPISFLRKRMVKTGNPFETLVLEELPDIILTSGKENFYKNYMGVTILNISKKDTYFILDLKSREVEEVAI